jgi:hypothetical protein
LITYAALGDHDGLPVVVTPDVGDHSTRVNVARICNCSASHAFLSPKFVCPSGSVGEGGGVKLREGFLVERCQCSIQTLNPVNEARYVHRIPSCIRSLHPYPSWRPQGVPPLPFLHPPLAFSPPLCGLGLKLQEALDGKLHTPSGVAHEGGIAAMHG